MKQQLEGHNPTDDFEDAWKTHLQSYIDYKTSNLNYYKGDGKQYATGDEVERLQATIKALEEGKKIAALPPTTAMEAIKAQYKVISLPLGHSPEPELTAVNIGFEQEYLIPFLFRLHLGSLLCRRETIERRGSCTLSLSATESIFHYHSMRDLQPSPFRLISLLMRLLWLPFLVTLHLLQVAFLREEQFKCLGS